MKLVQTPTHHLEVTSGPEVILTKQSELSQVMQLPSERIAGCKASPGKDAEQKLPSASGRLLRAKQPKHTLPVPVPCASSSPEKLSHAAAH